MDKLDRKRALKLRFRRHLRLQKRQVEELSVQAEQLLEDDFFKRLERLGLVRRFVATWLLLVILLIAAVAGQLRGLSGYYQVLGPAPGGTYTEGVLGAFTNANPIYATDMVDTSVSHLVFAGLMTYDEHNQLVGDLAQRIDVDDAGTTYTLKLRPNLTWHDGEALTAADVAFTYQVIQNPDARSPLFSSWTGIKVAALDRRTLTFTLPNPLASFPYSLTNGIVPQHILGGIPMIDMRSVSFNSTRPIGSGPFRWQAIELTGGSADKRQETIALKAFDDYYGGKPKLNNFIIRTFRERQQLVDAFQRQEVLGMAGLTQVPGEVKGDGGVRIYNLPLTAAVMTFFRTHNGLLASGRLRQALVLGTDTRSIIGGLPYATSPVRSPLLYGQLAHNPQYYQPSFDQAAAVRILEEEGWKAGQNGLRAKDGVPLAITLTYLDSAEYSSVAHQLAKAWRVIGVDVKLDGQAESDFQTVLSSAPSPDNPLNDTYDALLYGISIGVDPDVYVYWHSSQVDLRSPTRLNFSAYKSGTADGGLEAGRTRLDAALRVAKYQPFLQAWQADLPALGLYQPRFLYITHGPVYGLSEAAVNTDASRYRNVHNWQIREKWVTPE